MHFASPLPWWLTLIVVAVIAATAYYSYRRPLAPLSTVQRALLVGLRVFSLGAVALLLCRPVFRVPPAADEITVPVLVDASRSMRVADADGRTRIARAIQLVEDELLPSLSGQFKLELHAVGDEAAPATVEKLGADARQSDLTGALAAVRDRYRGRRIAGIVLLSDGADTGQQEPVHSELGHGPPVLAIGIGSPDGPPDREVIALTAGDPRLDRASVDLRVSAVSHGFGQEPFELRVLANGRLAESRRVAPAADGSPVEEVFTVLPDALTATVFTVSIDGEGESESIRENNTRAVLISPAGRPRRILALQGAPGFDHSYLGRVWARDRGLEIDSVVRKGRDEMGKDTFLVQAVAARTAALTAGFPSTREALYAYDALIIANLEADFFTRAQLEQVADFVSERGGGLLVFGGRSFVQRGLIGSALEEVLPVELDDRRGGVTQAAFDVDRAAVHNTVTVTRDGISHPMMRLSSSLAETRRLWSSLPPLAGSAALGGPRPGASVLALTTAPSGATYPLIAVQRYGRGRSMVFGGEASWRWRMLMPSTDRTYEYFWRQAARWLSASSPGPVTISVPDAPEPEDEVEISIEARDGAFVPVPEATIAATITLPGAGATPLTLRREAEGAVFSAAFRPTQAGLYRVHAEAHQRGTSLGVADRWFYVGGSDREFADPRLNEGFLRRIAEASGGQYVRTERAGEMMPWLQATAMRADPEIRDLWHRPSVVALIVALLSGEWILRRRWGLR
jgi:uncharacterized membrane protein